MSDVIGLEVSALQVTPFPVWGDRPVIAAEPVAHDVRSSLHRDIQALWDDVVRQGALVEVAVIACVKALVEGDIALAESVVAGDAEVNALQQRVRLASHRVLMTQQPMCRDLRAVLAAVQMSSDLERMGDHCASVAKQARALAGLPGSPVNPLLPTLGSLCAGQVHDILGTIVRGDADGAVAVAARDDEVDTCYHGLVDALAGSVARGAAPAFRVTTLLLAAHHLERIGDRVTNLAEQVVFAVTGDQPRLG